MSTDNHTLIRECEKRFFALKEGLLFYYIQIDFLIKDLTRYIHPYDQSSITTMWDTTASTACIKFASLISSLITPAGQRWPLL